MSNPILSLATAGDLAQNAEAPKGAVPYGEGNVMEPKFDGWRILAHVGEGAVQFFSRSGKGYSMPLVEAELLAAFPAGSWLDGEAVAYTVAENGMVTDEWHVVQSSLSNPANPKASMVRYMVFDLIAHRSIDARSLPFMKRRELLEAIFAGAEFNRVLLAPQLPATEATHAMLVAKGFEGSMVKRLNARYASGKRGAGWTKVKPTKTVEGVVMGFQPGKNGFSGMVGAVIFGQYDGQGNLVERGKVSGMDGRTRVDMTQHPQKYLGKVIEVAHEGVSIGATDSGRFRFPRFKRMRPDKAAAQVTIHDA